MGYIGVITQLLTIDPIFLGHPSSLFWPLKPSGRSTPHPIPPLSNDVFSDDTSVTNGKRTSPTLAQSATILLWHCFFCVGLLLKYCLLYVNYSIFCSELSEIVVILKATKAWKHMKTPFQRFQRNDALTKNMKRVPPPKKKHSYPRPDMVFRLIETRFILRKEKSCRDFQSQVSTCVSFLEYNCITIIFQLVFETLPPIRTRIQLQ